MFFLNLANLSNCVTNQGEEAFLQNLFANTLLSDEIYATNNLGNLDLNYNLAVTNESNSQTIASDLVQSLGENDSQKVEANNLVLDPMTDFVLNLDTSFNLNVRIHL